MDTSATDSVDASSGRLAPRERWPRHTPRARSTRAGGGPVWPSVERHPSAGPATPSRRYAGIAQTAAIASIAPTNPAHSIRGQFRPAFPHSERERERGGGDGQAEHHVGSGLPGHDREAGNGQEPHRGDQAEPTVGQCPPQPVGHQGDSEGGQRRRQSGEKHRGGAPPAHQRRGRDVHRGRLVRIRLPKEAGHDVVAPLGHLTTDLGMP